MKKSLHTDIFYTALLLVFFLSFWSICAKYPQLRISKPTRHRLQAKGIGWFLGVGCWNMVSGWDRGKVRPLENQRLFIKWIFIGILLNLVIAGFRLCGKQQGNPRNWFLGTMEATAWNWKFFYSWSFGFSLHSREGLYMKERGFRNGNERLIVLVNQ